MSRAALRIVASAPEPAPRTFDPHRRGYVIQYRRGEANFCPGCGRSNWHVGRHTAECAFCSLALPLGPEVAHV